MNILLWILQILLAVINAFHGWLYVTWTPATEQRFMERRPGTKPIGLPSSLRTFIGLAELLAAPGLILPQATGIMPILTPLAAAGFAIIMVGAAVYHFRRDETSIGIVCAVICVVSAFVAYMRW